MHQPAKIRFSPEESATVGIEGRFVGTGVMAGPGCLADAGLLQPPEDEAGQVETTLVGRIADREEAI
jgi:hypothetical protein